MISKAIEKCRRLKRQNKINLIAIYVYVGIMVLALLIAIFTVIFNGG